MLKEEYKALKRPFGGHLSGVVVCPLVKKTASALQRGDCGVSAGFSLVELMVGIAVAVVLLTTIIPSVADMMSRNELAVAANGARGALRAAREMAIISGRPVSLCAGVPEMGCSGNWSNGQWLVFRDSNHNGDLDAGEAVLQHGSVPGAGRGILIDGNGPFRSALIYMPLGHAERVSGAFGAGRLRVCLDQDIKPNARELVVSSTGRVRMQRVDLAGRCPPL